MKILLIGPASLLLAIATLANDPDKKPPKPPEATNVTTVVKQVAKGGDAVATSQAQGGTASNGAQSNLQELKVPRQAPTVISPDSIPTAPCRVAFGAGASAPVGGISVGGSKSDEECNKRETARAFALLGYKLEAVTILCTTNIAKKALRKQCPVLVERLQLQQEQ